MTDVKRTPWDEAVFGIPTYEIKTYTEDVLKRISGMNGHFSIKVPPLTNKRLLHQYGFYYCDTLFEPVANISDFRPVEHSEVTVEQILDAGDLAEMCRGTFVYDRFHRDFNLDSKAADERYVRWSSQLLDEGYVLLLMYEGEKAGFFACHDNRIVLHALVHDYRGKGLAKYFWSEACRHLFALGHQSLRSSVSATNMSVVNLYRSLGFAFENPVDIYHKWQTPREKEG